MFWPLTNFSRFSLVIGAFLGITQISSAQVTAAFEADTTFGCNVLGVVNFSDLSTGSITSWEWDFGNGNSSTLQNPTESYTQKGSFTVSLIVSDGVSSDTVTKTDFIRVFDSPSANFSVDTSKGCPPLEVTFSNLSVAGDNPIKKRIWDFGDGNSSNADNPTHLYNAPGLKPTSLILIDTAGCASSFIGSVINVLAGPVVNFETVGARDTCETTLTVDFTNTTLNKSASTSYHWDFGDGDTSNLEDPTHTYTVEGKYDVSLIASNGFCSDTLLIKEYVKLAPLQSMFNFYRDTLGIVRSDTFCLADTVFFLNHSSGANQFQWDFGDANQSTDENPFHMYADSGWYDVTLTIQSNGACLSDTTMSVYIERAIPSFTSTPSFICQPDTFFYTSTSPNAVEWTWKHSGPMGSSITQTGETTFFRQSDEGVFADKLIVTTLAGCVDSIQVAENREADFPEIYLFPDTVYRGCSPISIQFSDSTVSNIPITSRLWVFGNGNSSTDSLPPIQTFVDDSIYTITFSATDSLGCINTATTQAFVGSPTMPEISLARGDRAKAVIIDLGDTLCLNDTLNFSEISGDLSIKSWNWKVLHYDDKPIVKGAQKATILIPDTGIYSLELKVANNGCDSLTVIDTAFVVSGPIANPFAQIDSCNDLSFTMIANATDDADEFFWDFGDGNSSDSAKPSHQYTTPGEYLVEYEIRNSLSGCEVSGKFKIRAFEINNTIVSNNNTIGCAPFFVDLTTPPNSSSISDWIFPDGSTSRSTGIRDTLDTPGIYTYELTQTNIYGCQKTTTRDIKVYGPKASAFVDQTLGGYCIPYVVEFKDNSSYDTTFSSIFWDFGNGTTGNKQIDTASYTIHNDSISWFMIVEDVLGCRDTIGNDSTVQFVTPNLLADFNILDSTICVGDTAFFVNSSIHIGAAEAYRWEFGDEDSSFFKDTSHVFLSQDSFPVTLHLLNLTNCQMSITKTISVQDKPVPAFFADTLDANCYPLPVNFTDTTSSPFVSKWEWDFDDGGFSSIQNPFHNFGRPGGFDITLTATTTNGCSDTLTKVDYIQTSGPFAEVIHSEDSLCKYEDIIFSMINPSNVKDVFWNFGDGDTASGPQVTYQYRTITGTIFPTMILSDSNTCFVTFRDTVFVEDVIADFNADDIRGCVPLEVNLLNTSNRADTWQWNFGDGNGSADFNTAHTYDSVGSFTLSLNITNQENGCVDTALQEITVTEVPDARVSSDTTICEGDTILLSASGGDIYQWLPFSFLENSDSSRTLSFPTSNTSYQVIISSNEGCVDTANIDIDVLAKPQSYSLRDTNIIIGETVDFNVFSGTDFSYLWTPSDGLSCTDCFDPTAQPLISTLYKMQVSDTLGCFNMLDSVFIEVKVAFTLEIPEGFTPNGDGLNDRIFVRGWGLKELLKFQIYNRWGEVVYESTDFQEGWDGNFKGEPQGIETYVFIVQALTFNDEVIFKKGNFKLIR